MVPLPPQNAVKSHLVEAPNVIIVHLLPLFQIVEAQLKEVRSSVDHPVIVVIALFTSPMCTDQKYLVLALLYEGQLFEIIVATIDH